MRHSIPEDISNVLKVDSTSSTGLRWIKTVNSRAKKGQEAGCKWRVPGRDRVQYSTRYKKVLMLNHRIIYFLTYGVDPAEFDVDHKNRDSTLNTEKNLRLANGSQNQGNSAIQKNNSSGFKGVCWCKEKKKWQAGISHKKKYKFLGRYDTKEEAARAYDKAAKEYFGEFAWLNFPEDHST